MKVLVIGSGGREHALCWKIAQSPKVETVFAAPGNGGLYGMADIVDTEADDIDGLLKFALSEKIDLTVVGPEAPLVGGIVDVFSRHGLRIFGPDKRASLLEGSKIFAKEMMRRCNVPTADFSVFDDYKKACGYLKSADMPVVIKADGLAAGKGVVICRDVDEALANVRSFMVDKRFGASGEKVVIEECLEGEEASIIVVSDGVNVVPLASSQDHKRIFDEDKGPNTGGMGAYSPAPIITSSLEQRIMKEIIMPMIKGMRQDNVPYKGVLYAGIMVTKDGPKVLEFNVRFGDPETQAILPRLKSDLVDIIERSLDGDLKGFRLSWDKKSCVCVVVSSKGYPGSYEKGKIIKGLEKAKSMEDIVVFHAGTKKISDGGKEGIVTSGGRVLGVTGLGETIELAINKAYEGTSAISFEGMHFRRDIGKRALRHSGIIL
ncbi:MAG: phosphoribosylamine--glycine ligase [Candidatus Omnitrophica bacterium]|nr:phosphoribosylamine--glycine ligase [Candidatus Omnitrophota bacterium]